MTIPLLKKIYTSDEFTDAIHIAKTANEYYYNTEIATLNSGAAISIIVPQWQSNKGEGACILFTGDLDAFDEEGADFSWEGHLVGVPESHHWDIFDHQTQQTPLATAFLNAALSKDVCRQDKPADICIGLHAQECELISAPAGTTEPLAITSGGGCSTSAVWACLPDYDAASGKRCCDIKNVATSQITGTQTTASTVCCPAASVAIFTTTGSSGTNITTKTCCAEGYAPSGTAGSQICCPTDEENIDGVCCKPGSVLDRNLECCETGALNADSTCCAEHDVGIDPTDPNKKRCCGADMKDGNNVCCESGTSPDSSADKVCCSTGEKDKDDKCCTGQDASGNTLTLDDEKTCCAENNIATAQDGSKTCCASGTSPTKNLNDDSIEACCAAGTTPDEEGNCCAEELKDTSTGLCCTDQKPLAKDGSPDGANICCTSADNVHDYTSSGGESLKICCPDGEAPDSNGVCCAADSKATSTDASGQETTTCCTDGKEPTGDAGKQICCAADEHNEGGICCKAGQTNLGGVCCANPAKDESGADVCCDAAGQTPVDGLCCPAGSKNIDGACCAAENAAKDENGADICCTDAGKEIVGGLCCASGSKAIDGKCCAAENAAKDENGADICCTTGNIAGGLCCPVGQINVGGACAIPTVPCTSGAIDTAGYCCPAGSAIDGKGRCCESGNVSDGLCCPVGHINVSGACVMPQPNLVTEVTTDAEGAVLLKAMRSNSTAFTIRNTGTATAAAVVWQARIGADVVSEGVIASLPAGAALAITVRIDDARLPAQVCVIADAENAIVETYENDNSACALLKTQPTAAATPVPTLGTLALAFSSLALAGAAAPTLHRRRRRKGTPGGVER